VSIAKGYSRRYLTINLYLAASTIVLFSAITSSRNMAFFRLNTFISITTLMRY